MGIAEGRSNNLINKPFVATAPALRVAVALLLWLSAEGFKVPLHPIDPEPSSLASQSCENVNPLRSGSLTSSPRSTPWHSSTRRAVKKTVGT